MPEDNRWPFEYGARENFAPITTRTINAAAMSTDLEPIKIPEVGFAGELLISVQGTVTASGAGTYKARNLAALFKKVRLESNINNQIVDCSGYGLAKLQETMYPGFGYDKAPVGASAPSANYYAGAIAGAGAQAFKFTLAVPLNFNFGRQFSKGLIMLNAEGVQVTLTLSLGALADLSTSLTDINATVYVSYRLYEMVDENVYKLPPLSLMRILETSKGVTATGENTVEIPRTGVVYNLIHYLENNAAFADANIDRVGLNFDESQKAYYQYLFENQWLYRRTLGVDLPVGHWGYNFAASDGMVNSAVTDRDAIDVRRVSVLGSMFNVPGSVTLTNAKVYTVRRIWQQLN